VAFLHFDNVGIVALAGALPDHVQAINMDTQHPRAVYIANFVKQTGIRLRHISITEQTCTDLGYAALRKALSKAGWDAQSLDALIFMSQTPDFNPSTSNAHVLHNHMNLGRDTLAFDITLGCSSFPYGLSVCAALLQQTHINRIAMVSGDTVWPQYSSREELLAASTFLTGEGSTALLLENREFSPLDISLHSDGSGYHFLYDPWQGSRNAWRRVKGIIPNGVVYEGGGGYMDGMEITSFATLRVVDSIKSFLEHAGKSLKDFDGLVLHQANIQILKAMARRLKIDMAKVPTTVERLGNTNGASVSLTMVDAYAEAKSGPLNLLVSAFGVGLSWGVVSLSLEPSVIVPMITCSDRFEEDFLKPTA
jgi:3-oxoacyl-[acyl-carrier-protein] synthase-3